MIKCIFCKIVSRELPAKIIYENDKTLAFLSVDPIENGHALVIPKKHIRDFLSSDQEILSEVAKTKQKVAKLIAQKLKIVDFNFLNNNGEQAFQEVFHYHEHIIPKYVKSQGFFITKTDHKKEDLENIYKKIIN